MTEPRVRPAYPELKQLVAEASRALATLDADRLEELALCCQALNRELMPVGRADAGAAALARQVLTRQNLARQAREAAADMALFDRVLDATRANLKVLRRLRELRSGRFEYTGPEYSSPEWAATGSRHGHN